MVDFVLTSLFKGDPLGPFSGCAENRNRDFTGLLKIVMSGMEIATGVCGIIEEKSGGVR
jgi:hypothetical protein